MKIQRRIRNEKYGTTLGTDPRHLITIVRHWSLYWYEIQISNPVWSIVQRGCSRGGCCQLSIWNGVGGGERFVEIIIDLLIIELLLVNYRIINCRIIIYSNLINPITNYSNLINPIINYSNLINPKKWYQLPKQIRLTTPTLKKSVWKSQNCILWLARNMGIATLGGRVGIWDAIGSHDAQIMIRFLFARVRFAHLLPFAHLVSRADPRKVRFRHKWLSLGRA